MESIDDLLAQIKAEYQEPKSNQPPKKKSLLDEAEFAKPTSGSRSYQPPPPSQTWLSPAEENLLADLKAEFKQQEQAEEIKKQEQLRQEQLRQEQQLREEKLRSQQREQKRREALTQQANEWLQKLNPKSEEGLWFEEFSDSYPSKLEAAIDYMQALGETSLG
jgi:hypothetical protein